jgi:hypothetical protein
MSGYHEKGGENLVFSPLFYEVKDKGLEAFFMPPSCHPLC